MGCAFAAALGSIVLAMNRIVWPAAILSLLAMICAIGILASVRR